MKMSQIGKDYDKGSISRTERDAWYRKFYNHSIPADERILGICKKEVLTI